MLVPALYLALVHTQLQTLSQHTSVAHLLWLLQLLIHVCQDALKQLLSLSWLGWCLLDFSGNWCLPPIIQIVFLKCVPSEVPLSAFSETDVLLIPHHLIFLVFTVVLFFAIELCYQFRQVLVCWSVLLCQELSRLQQLHYLLSLHRSRVPYLDLLDHPFMFLHVSLLVPQCLLNHPYSLLKCHFFEAAPNDLRRLSPLYLVVVHLLLRYLIL